VADAGSRAGASAAGAGDNNVPLASFAFSRRALTLITLGHAILIGIMAMGTLQVTRALLNAREKPST